jgi:hypothetical protein
MSFSRARLSTTAISAASSTTFLRLLIYPHKAHFALCSGESANAPKRKDTMQFRKISKAKWLPRESSVQGKGRHRLAGPDFLTSPKFERSTLWLEVGRVRRLLRFSLADGERRKSRKPAPLHIQCS